MLKGRIKREVLVNEMWEISIGEGGNCQEVCVTTQREVKRERDKSDERI